MTSRFYDLLSAYTKWAQRPASITDTKAAVDSGQAHIDFIIDMDVDMWQDNDLYQGRSPECETDGVFM